MSKRVVVALVIVFLLALALFFTRQEVQTTAEQADWSVEPSEELDRLEIGDGVLTVVFERGGEGWRQVEPVDALVSVDAAADMEAIFAAGIDSDLAMAPVDGEGGLGLQGEGVKHLKAFAGERVVAEFSVGVSVRVPNTNAQRTWLQPEGSALAYRSWSPAAGSDLSRTFGRALEAWRERRVLRLARSELEAITLEGAGPSVRLMLEGAPTAGEAGTQQPKPVWRMVEPEGVKADPIAVSGVVTTLSSLRVDGFADGVVASELGLEPPVRRLLVKTPTRELVIELGVQVTKGPHPEQAPDDKARYMRVSGEPFVYMIDGATSTSLMRRLGELREKRVWTLRADAIQELRVSGEEPFSLRREGQGWRLESALTSGPAITKNVEKMVHALTTLQAVAFEDGGELASEGLEGAGAYIVTIVLSDGSTRTLALGATVEGGEDLRFARVDRGLTFTLRGYTASDVMQTVAALITSTGDAPQIGAPSSLASPLDQQGSPR